MVIVAKKHIKRISPACFIKNGQIIYLKTTLILGHHQDTRGID
jgi:hypothetical protein